MGRWQMVLTPKSAGLMLTGGKKVEVSFERESLRDCWLPATILKNSGNNTFLVEYQQPGTGDVPFLHKVTVDCSHIRPTPPHLRDKNFALLEKVDAYYDFGWWSGVITKEFPDNRYNVFFKHTKKEREFIYSSIRPHMEWKGGKWFNASQGDTDGRTTLFLIDEQIEQASPNIDKQSTVATSIMKKTSQENLDSYDKSLQASDEGSKADSIKTRTQEIVGKKDTTKDRVLPVVMDFECNMLTVSETRLIQKWSIKKKPKITEHDTQRPSVPFSPQTVAEKVASGGDSASITPKRKRGRPPKSLASSPKSPATFDNQNRVLPYALFVMEGGQKKEVGLSTSLATKSLEENQEPVKEQPTMQNTLLSKDKLPNENTGQDLDVQLDQGTKKQSAKNGKRVKRRTVGINTQSPAQVFDVDSQESKEKSDGSLEKDSATRNPEASIGKSLDTPLSRKFEAKHPPIIVHGPEGTVEQSSKVSETCVMDSEDLPFVRSTSLWKTIESMEAFRTLPQKPHFRPLLEGVKESAREGLAIGSMVTYSTIVDKIYGLRFDDPRSTIEDFLETLAELENNGFDVKVIRERLTRLLLLKDKQKELAERSKEVVEEIEEHNVQGKINDEEIEAIDRQIRELEEKRKQVMLKKEKSNSVIGVMETMNKAIEKETRGAGAEFDGLAAAPFC